MSGTPEKAVPEKAAKAAGPRLGRGLAALLGDTALSAPRADRTALPVSALEPGPFQPRTHMDDAALAELASSIKHQGVLQPVLARPHPDKEGLYQIIAGERRWRASQLAGLHEVPVLVRKFSDTEAMAAGLVENLQREDLDPIEEAEGYRRLLEEHGLTQDNLGNLVGKSRSHIANTTRLLNLPDPVRAQVSARQLSAGHARALLTHPDPEAAARAVIARGLNVRQTEALVTRLAEKPAPKKLSNNEELERAALEKQLGTALGLSVRISPNSGTSGTVQISYRTLDQLDALLERLQSPSWRG